MMRALPPRDQKLAAAERQTATRSNKAHGRVEKRTLISSTGLNDYLGWPGVQQCFKLTRSRTIHGKSSTETVFGITSLPRAKAPARTLLKLTRDHWSIENGVFHVRDMTLGEDACRVRTGNAPLILSTLRNAIINLLNKAGANNKAATLRRHAALPAEALALLMTPG
jgi:predicted transposase YbfD/YdcC